MISYTRTNSDNRDFADLVVLLDADLAVRDGEDHAFYAQFNKTNMIRQVVVAYEGRHAVACGAIKPFEEGVMEVKRMYVRETHRRMGLAQGVLAELEKWAMELGCERLVLETGRNQPEAINLYKKMGYQVTENYGQYIGIENSVCFSRIL